MSARLPLPPPGFDELPVDQKLDYVLALSDRIVTDPAEVPTPDWHREVLQDRLRDADKNKCDGLKWDFVRDDLMRELRAKQSEQT